MNRSATYELGGAKKLLFICSFLCVCCFAVAQPCTPPTVTVVEKEICQNEKFHLTFTGTPPFVLGYSLGLGQKITIFGMDTALAVRQSGENVFIVYDLVDGKGCSLPKDPNGVEIGGILWAKYNVDAPGTFAKNPEDAGMLYQWNSKIAWSSTNPLVSVPAGKVWNSAWNGNNAEIWEKVNDPCPEGWRVPTSRELPAIMYGTCEIRNGIKGIRVGSVFLPHTTGRNSDATFKDEYRCFWSNSRLYDNYAGIIYIAGIWWEAGLNVQYAGGYMLNSEAHPVRCVKDFPSDTIMVNPLKYSTVSPVICPGDSVLFNGKYYKEAGSYPDTLHTSFCDSVVTLKLVVYQECITVKPCASPSITMLEKDVCQNDSIHVVFTGTAPFVLDYSFNGGRRKITVFGMDTAFVATQAGENVFIVYDLVDATGCSFEVSDKDAVKINGLVWAKYNVDAPGTFTKKVEDTGMFYQWNGNIGWSLTNPLVSIPVGKVWNSAWNGNNAGNWEKANDPCPNGFRVPTKIELQTLREGTWTANYNSTGVAGRTFIDGANELFLPISGFRAVNGSIIDAGGGYYWTNTPVFEIVYNFGFGSVAAFVGTSHRGDGLLVRCIKEFEIDTITVHTTQTKTITATICKTETYLFNGKPYTQTGTYTDTLQTSFGCDSIVTLNLTVVAPDTTRINATIFVGEGYNRHGFTIPIQTEVGTLRDTLRLKSKFLCDSTVILTLKIDSICTPPTITILEKDVCQNDSIHVIFTGTAPFELDYSLNGVRRKITVFGMDTAFVATQTGENVFIVYDLISATGCSSHDSKDGVEINGIIWAKYNVDAPNTFTKNPEDAGMFYQWNRNVGLSSTNPLVSTDGSPWTLVWNGNTATMWEETNNVCPKGWRVPTNAELTNLVNAGSYWGTENGVNGRIFGNGKNTIFLPAANARNGYQDGTFITTADQGMYWSSRSGYFGHAYDLTFDKGSCYPINSAIHTANYTAMSIRCVKDTQKDTLTVHPTKTETITKIICSNENYLFNGKNYNQTGTYTDTLQTSFGCDSIVTLKLTVNPAFDLQETITMCENELPLIFRDTTFRAGTQSGTYVFKRKTILGCDSTVTLNLTVHNSYNLSEQILLCDAVFPFAYHDTTFTVGTISGNYVLRRKTIHGCDSTITLTLRVNEPNFPEYITICDSELPLTFRDTTFKAGTASGNYVFNRKSLYNCDSIVMLKLTVNKSFTVFDTIVLYEHDLPFTYLGTTFSLGSYGGDYVFPRKTIFGCDSVINLNLTIYQTLRQTMCESELPAAIRDTLFLQGTQSGVYTVDKGLTTLILTVNSTPEFTISNTDIIACTNADYEKIVAAHFTPPFNANARLQWTIIHENGDRYTLPNTTNQTLYADTVLFPDVGTYRIEVVYQYQSNGRLCNSATSITDYVVFEPPYPPIVVPKTMCEGELTPLQAFGSPLIQWISADKKLPDWSGETYDFHRLGQSDIPLGTYEFELYDIDAVSGCESERVSLSFEVTPAANPKIVGRTEFCLQAIEEMYAVETAAQGSDYFWKTSGNQYNYSKDGNPYSPNRYVDWYGVGIDTLYVYERTYAGCEGYDTLVVFIADYPKPYYTWTLPSASATIEFTDSSYQAPIIAQNPDGTQVEIPLTYTMEWFFDTNDNRDTAVVDMFVEYFDRFNPIQVEDYTYGFKYPLLTVTNDFGCRASYVTEIFVDIPNGIYIPNAFGPSNAAASVRVFKPVAYNLEYCKVWIYDKWGNLLWYGNRVEHGAFVDEWNGTYNGELLQSDVYIWKIEAKFLNGTTWAGQKKPIGGYSKFGAVVLIR